MEVLREVSRGFGVDRERDESFGVGETREEALDLFDVGGQLGGETLAPEALEAGETRPRRLRRRVVATVAGEREREREREREG